MSRCFPFPPPGYEKKAKLDDTDLLEKEKQRERRHKKEKKDKEKRGERKEKKQNGKNKEKHKDKKERKEKHKEKEKEKNRSSDAKKNEPRKGSHDEEKLEFNNFKTDDLKNSKYVQELAKRIRDENGASGSQMVESVAAPDDRRVELARKFRGLDGASGSQMVEKIASDERKVKLPGMVAETIVNRKSEKEKVKNKKEDHQKVNGQQNHFAARGAAIPSGQIPSQLDQERDEPITKPLPKDNFDMRVEGKQKGEVITKPLPKENVEKLVKGKEKSKRKEREGKGDKDKDRDKGKDKKSKDKDGDKEKKTEEKAKESRESNKEHTKSKGSDPKLKENAKESLDFRNTKLPDPPKLSNPGLPSDGTLGKRKEPERNGHLLDEENWSDRSAKHLSLHQPVNGTERKPERIRTATELRVQGATNNHVVVAKDIKINGFILPQQHNETPAKPTATHSTRNENGETSVKPSHPDTKYLSQILRVPMVEDLPDSLDQEWLLGSEPRASKKLKECSPAVDGTLEVWSEAMRIESADISALPYVIPY